MTSKNSILTTRNYFLLIVLLIGNILVSALPMPNGPSYDIKGLLHISIYNIIVTILLFLLSAWYEYSNEIKELRSSFNDICNFIEINTNEKINLAKKIYTDQNDLVKKFQEIKSNASSFCCLYWCGLYSWKDDDYKEYFDLENKMLSTKSSNFIMKRLINKKNIRQKLIHKHKSILTENLGLNKKYDYCTYDIDNLELVIANYQPIPENPGYLPECALLVLLDDQNNPKWGYYFDGKNNDDLHVINTLKEMFNKKWDEAMAEKIKKGQASWDVISNQYDLLVTNSSNKILKAYQEGERKFIIEEIIKTLADQNVTIIEVGCGTGRFLIDLLNQNLDDKTDHKIINIIGIDSSVNMVNEFRVKIAEGLSKTEIPQKYSNIIKPIKADAEELFNAVKDIISPHDSCVIVLCVLNTLGIIDNSDTRGKIVCQMIETAGKNGRIFVSVFNAKSFQQHVTEIYTPLVDMVGPFIIADIDFANNDFYTQNDYYSHWFKETEIYKLVKEMDENNKHWFNRNEVLSVIHKRVNPDKLLKPKKIEKEFIGDIGIIIYHSNT